MDLIIGLPIVSSPCRPAMFIGWSVFYLYYIYRYIHVHNELHSTFAYKISCRSHSITVSFYKYKCLLAATNAFRRVPNSPHLAEFSFMLILLKIICYFPFNIPTNLNLFMHLIFLRFNFHIYFTALRPGKPLSRLSQPRII